MRNTQETLVPTSISLSLINFHLIVVSKTVWKHGKCYYLFLKYRCLLKKASEDIALNFMCLCKIFNTFLITLKLCGGSHTLSGA